MEKITFCINNQKYMFVEFWSKWIKFITPIEPKLFCYRTYVLCLYINIVPTSLSFVNMFCYNLNII